LAAAQQETTLLYHLAAIYDLAVPREPAMRVNVEGTRQVNDLALRMPNLAFYHYISTCYVAGKRTGLIRENELRHEAGFRNYYEETKYLAELEAEQMKARLPVVIHRPSVVCGDSRTGETAKYDGVYYLINYIRLLPKLFSLVNIGNDRVRVNLVPVDFIVDALAALARDERALGQTLQLADPAPLTTREIFDACAQAIAGKTSLGALPMSLTQRALMLPWTPALTGLPHSGAPYFFLEQTYDTHTAQELLAPRGVVCPRFDSYVGNLVNFVANHPTLP
jgi:thioester reductase-like protein